MLTGACGAKHGCEETKPLSSGLLRGLWGPVFEASIFSPHFRSTLFLLVNIPCGGQAALEVNLAEWRVHAALSVPRVVTWCFRRPAASCWYEVGKAPASLRYIFLPPGTVTQCHFVAYWIPFDSTMQPDFSSAVPCLLAFDPLPRNFCGSYRCLHY